MNNWEMFFWTDRSSDPRDPRAPAGGGGLGQFRIPGSVGIDSLDGSPFLHPFAPAARINGCILGAVTPVAAAREPSWEEIVADFGLWEGRIQHMYLDTEGFVTVGIGNLIASAEAAKSLAFVARDTGAAATAQEIEADFKAVAKQAKGELAASYKKFTKLDLPDNAIDALFRIKIDGFKSDLMANFTGYAEYPVEVKRALLDMIYNLGKGGLLKFRKLKAAVERRDWKEAAAQCHRNGPSKARNDWTRDLFLKAGT
jgi:GH24 family phage-related lysozyme (muramidase)